MPIKLSKKDSETLAKQSPMFTLLGKTLIDGFNRLLGGECSEEEVGYTIAKINPEANGYYNPKDYLTLDKCMRILGYGQNRVGCTALLKKHKIFNEKFNNVNIGYNRTRVLALKEQLKEEVYKREYKKRMKELKERRKEKNYGKSKS